MLYKQRPSRVFYDDKLKKYYITQIVPNVVNGRSKGKKLVKAYIKDIPESILSGPPSKAINAVQKWVSDKYMGNLSLPDSKIDNSERLMYYKFPSFKPTNYTSGDKLQEKIAKESKETVAQQRVKQAIEYVKDPIKFGVADFTDAEITEAKKQIANLATVEANTLAQNLMASEVAKREKAEAERLKAETERKNIEEVKNKISNILKGKPYNLPLSVVPPVILNGTLDDLKIIYNLVSGFAGMTPTKIKQIFKIAGPLKGVTWDNTGPKGGIKYLPGGDDIQKAMELILNSPLSKIKELNDQLRFTPISGSGDGGAPSKLPPLWDYQIEDFFDKEPNFAGTISADEIKDLPNKIPMGFIMNTLPRDAPESKTGHWVATYISGDSVEYYDPLGDAPDKQYMIDIKEKINSMHLPILMKFKVNAVKDQHGNSQHCGYHCIRFLDDRFHGIPYAMTTRYDVNREGKIDDSKEGEKKIAEQFKLI